jgi:glycosyltransferase involved in cell wall biosynthesis
VTSVHVLIDAINDNGELRGPDRYLVGLLTGLAKIDRQTRYTICYAPWQRAIAKLKLPANFRLERVDAPRGRLRRVLWHALRFPRIAARFRPDVVHLPNVILAPRLRAPSVMTVHDLAHFRFPEKFGRWRGYAQRLQIRAALRVPERVIAVSRFTGEDLRRFAGYPERRLRHISEGGPEWATSAAAGAAEAPYFLCVGQLERSKNVEGLVEAFCASDALRRAGVELRIAGRRGNAAERIERRIPQHDAGRVKLLGYVDDESLSQLYSRCVAFVFPSLVEGFGLVLLEAMAHGAPVVALRTAAIPEVVGDAALLIDPHDASGLRDAMERLFRDAPLREQLRRRGHQRVRRFSWQETARQTLAVFREVAA